MCDEKHEKGYILVNVPEKCTSCHFYYKGLQVSTGIFNIYCKLNRMIDMDSTVYKPDSCPIHSFPLKIDVWKSYSGLSEQWIDGWNACIEHMEEENGNL